MSDHHMEEKLLWLEREAASGGDLIVAEIAAHARAEIDRLRAMQKIADDTINALEDQMQVLMQENAQKRDALRRLRDCDWVITPADRMDAVRDIAKEALGDE